MNVKLVLTDILKSFTTGASLTDSLIIGTILLILTVIVISIVYIMKSLSASHSQQITLVSIPLDLSTKNSLPKIIDGSKIPIVTLGKSFSFSFWLYLTDGYISTNDHKLILSRGSGGNSNPVVCMDKSTNKMYIAIATSNVLTTDLSLADILETNENGSYTSGYIVAVVGYVPMQRWVSFVVSVQDDSIMVFVDSDLYSVSNVTDAANTNTNTRPIIRGTSGDITIGDVKNSCSGFLTKLNYNNYAINANAISALYVSGPGQPNFLTAIGMPSYSLRFPIYKM